jgi:hypothetical protein
MTSMLPDVEPDHRSPTRRRLTRALLAVAGIGFATFWIWALFFASKEAVNRIGDTAWAARAETICADANAARLELSDYRQLGDGDAELIRERADIVDRSTDIIETMLDDVAAATPTDEKGRAIVPMWEAEYRAYIAARRDFADDLRATGENLPFYEPADDGLPISERLETFAGDNDMPACAPPRDLTR